MMANPLYNQPQAPLSGVYTKKNIRGSKGVSKGSCRDSKKFKVNGKGCKWVAESPLDRCKLSGAQNGCKKSCKNCPCNNGSDGSELNGEEACEEHGYNEQECLEIGNDCCHYKQNYCWSSIGQDECKGLGGR